MPLTKVTKTMTDVLDSPSFTGTPTAPTPASGDNSTKLATTAYVSGEISKIPQPESLSTSFKNALNGTSFNVTLDGTSHAIWSGEPVGKLSNISLPGSLLKSARVSPDGLYLAIVHANSPYVSIFSIDYESGQFHKLNHAAFSSNANRVEWTPDGKCLVVGSSVSPYVQIYKFSTSDLTFTLGTVDTARLPATDQVTPFVFSIDSKKMIAKGYRFTTVHNHYLFEFSLDTNSATLTYKNHFFTPTSKQIYSFAVNPSNGDFFVHTNSTANGIVDVYSYDPVTTNFTYSYNLQIPLSTSTSDQMSFSPNGGFCAITHSSGNGATVFKKTTSSYSALSYSGTTTTTSKLDIAWHPSGLYFITSVGGVAGSFSNLYRVSDTTVTNAGSVYPAAASSDGWTACFTPNGKFYILGQAVAYLQVYKTPTPPKIASAVGIY